MSRFIQRTPRDAARPNSSGVILLGEVDAEDLLVLRLSGARAWKGPAQQVLTGPEEWVPEGRVES